MLPCLDYGTYGNDPVVEEVKTNPVYESRPLAIEMTNMTRDDHLDDEKTDLGNPGPLFRTSSLSKDTEEEIKRMKHITRFNSPSDDTFIKFKFKKMMGIKDIFKDGWYLLSMEYSPREDIHICVIKKEKEVGDDSLFFKGTRIIREGTDTIVLMVLFFVVECLLAVAPIKKRGKAYEREKNKGTRCSHHTLLSSFAWYSMCLLGVPCTCECTVQQKKVYGATTTQKRGHAQPDKIALPHPPSVPSVAVHT